MLQSKISRLHKYVIRSIVGFVALGLMILFTACGGGNGTGGTSNRITGTIVSVNASQHSAVLNVNGQQVTVNGLTDQEVTTLQTQIGKPYTLQVTGSGSSVNLDPNSTPEPNETTTVETPTTTQPSGVTQPPSTFKPGGISFIGPVKSITSSSLVMSAPNGQTYTMAITAQTDLSAFGGSLPTVGTSVNMDAVVNPDGSFTVTILKPAQPGDPDLHVIAYTGITTSAVGADRVLHFTVGTKSYTFTLPTTADLSDFGGNAQAIGNNVSVKVKVQVPANTVVSVANSNA